VVRSLIKDRSNSVSPPQNGQHKLSGWGSRVGPRFGYRFEMPARLLDLVYDIE
jgi:hypothetical protein